MSTLGIWRDDAPSADVLILPPDGVAGVLWRDPWGGTATEWARLPAESTAAMAVQLESVQRRAAVSKFVWPIPDSGIARRLHRVTAPTLIVWGDSDQANPPGYAEEWRARLADARVRSVPGGHMAVEESPRDVAGIVLDFLRPDV
jgi:pimeloyl-ACP methyl ester carboxylesterase